MSDIGIRKAIKAAGGVRALARLLGIDHASILRWKRVPAERLIEVERVTNVPRESLRPDLFRQPPKREADCA
jgi:DNA-binding transcriptional regulator YdaS (Cro superfamily)